MANPEQLAILKSGVTEWNAWRVDHPAQHVDLSEADLGAANLGVADLRQANLRQANLNGADLSSTDLSEADLGGTNLVYANLSADAILVHANLNNAILVQANLSRANLRGASLEHATFGGTVLTDTNLASVTGLDTCIHYGPSTLDHRTLVKSGPLPLAFLRGVGLPDLLIDLAPALRGNPLQLYPCFISYSSQDHVFAERLFNDLQGSGVRCWFAPKKLKPGDFFRAEIDQAINVYDKLLLILSEHSIASAWVADEVETALERERRTGKQVLFPIQIDDAVRNAGDWAAALRRRRHIGDMRAWKDPDAYRQAFSDFLNALHAEKAAP